MSGKSGGQPVTPSRGNVTQGSSTCSGSQPSTSSVGGITQEFCKGCAWTGKSLRGHLVRIKSPCKDLYNMQELKEQAHEVHRRHKDHWENVNREERLERKRQQSQGTTGASPQKRTIKVSAGVETTCGIDTSATCGHHAWQPVESHPRQPVEIPQAAGYAK